MTGLWRFLARITGRVVVPIQPIQQRRPDGPDRTISGTVTFTRADWERLGRPEAVVVDFVE